MVVSEFGHAEPGFRASILATDICAEVLHTALLGIYSESMIEPVPAEWRRRYVMKARGRSQATVRIVPELRALA